MSQFPFNKFPQRLKLLRKEKSITQSALGKDLEVSQNAIYNWENGKREPDLEMIAKISKYFNVSASYLLGYDSNRKAEMIKPTNSLAGWDQKITTIQTSNKRLEKLAIYFSKLNEKGQEKAVEQVELLTKIPEYRKEEPEYIKEDDYQL